MLLRQPEIGAQLRRLREQRKLSQAALSKRAGVASGDYLSKVERGGDGLSEESWAKIADALGVDVGVFYVGGRRPEPAQDGGLAAAMELGKRMNQGWLGGVYKDAGQLERSVRKISRGFQDRGREYLERWLERFLRKMEEANASKSSGRQAG